jgi:RHS repeat-associated protein
VLTYNGTSWTADQDIDSTRTLNAISCVSPSSCVAVDASGYVVIYSWSTATSQLTWDATGSLPLLLSDSTYDYVYGPGTTPVEQIGLASSTPTYLTYTQADSTWLSTNATGDETGFWGYDAFGILAFGTPTSAFGYAGQYADATTGLSDMRARWYTPGTGLFTSVDPDLAETGQAYAYADDDPVNEEDPSGLKGCWYCVFDPWSRANPIYTGIQNDPNGFGAKLARLNPAYQAINDYNNEIQDVENGCSWWTSVKAGGAGAFAAASTVGAAGTIAKGVTVLGAAVTGSTAGGGVAASVGGAAATLGGEAAASSIVDSLADTEQVTALLQGHVDAAVAEFNEDEIGLSDAQIAASEGNPGLEAAYRGSVIDAAAKQAILEDPALQGLYVTRTGEFGPDISDPITGRWWDMTTPGEWATHVAKYADPFGDGIPLYTTG